MHQITTMKVRTKYQKYSHFVNNFTKSGWFRRQQDPSHFHKNKKFSLNSNKNLYNYISTFNKQAKNLQDKQIVYKINTNKLIVPQGLNIKYGRMISKEYKLHMRRYDLLQLGTAGGQFQVLPKSCRSQRITCTPGSHRHRAMGSHMPKLRIGLR